MGIAAEGWSAGGTCSKVHCGTLHPIDRACLLLTVRQRSRRTWFVSIGIVHTNVIKSVLSGLIDNEAGTRDGGTCRNRREGL